jgi:serine kinase of HPr protein (carbohydrate metabolism regulator)
MKRLRGTCIAVEGSGVLLRGPSGCGKSDLALRLIEAGARLVADDYTDVVEAGGRVFAAPPPGLRGMLEVRGIGIVRLRYSASAPVVANIDLAQINNIERMPESESILILGVSVPSFRIAPFESSCVAKVRLVVGIASGSIMRIS